MNEEVETDDGSRDKQKRSRLQVVREKVMGLRDAGDSGRHTQETGSVCELTRGDREARE